MWLLQFQAPRRIFSDEECSSVSNRDRFIYHGWPSSAPSPGVFCRLPLFSRSRPPSSTHSVLSFLLPRPCLQSRGHSTPCTTRTCPQFAISHAPLCTSHSITHAAFVIPFCSRSDPESVVLLVSSCTGLFPSLSQLMPTSCSSRPSGLFFPFGFSLVSRLCLFLPFIPDIF